MDLPSYLEYMNAGKPVIGGSTMYRPESSGN